MKWIWLIWLLAVGCSAPPPHFGPPPTPKTPDPVVDNACLQHALDGTLTANLPSQIGPYRVTASARGAHLHRDGRAIDEADGKRFWDVFTHDVFGFGMAEAHYGMYSIYTCEDAPKSSCIKLDVWVCQTSLEALGGKLAAALERAGFGDAQLSVDLTFIEGPPQCRGSACKPEQHYSTHGTYDPARTRSSRDVGFGACSVDGDCEPDGQSCKAWYLRGGASTLEYRQYKWPTFCGCVEQRCRWFQQP